VVTKSDCSSVKFLHDLSSSRREPDWFLSSIVHLLNNSTKGPYSYNF